MKINCDFHIHSKYSLDGIMEPTEILRLAEERGLSAVAVADHNTAEGWHEAARLAPDGMLVVPAVEYATDKGHILALFIREELPEQYLRHTDWFHYEHQPVLDGIHAMGGLAVFAHPFKSESRDPAERNIFRDIDGIEVVNGRAAAKWNTDANRFAAVACDELKLPFSCGSDAHVRGEIGNVALTLEVEELTLDAVRAAFLSRTGSAAGRDTYCTQCAVSAFNKLRNKKWYKQMPKGIVYILWSMCMDMLKILHILPKNRYDYLIKDGVLLDSAHPAGKKG